MRFPTVILCALTSMVMACVVSFIAVPASSGATSSTSSCPLVSNVSPDGVHHGPGKRAIPIDMGEPSIDQDRDTVVYIVTATAAKNVRLCPGAANVWLNGRKIPMWMKTSRIAKKRIEAHIGDTLSVVVKGRRIILR